MRSGCSRCSQRRSPTSSSRAPVGGERSRAAHCALRPAARLVVTEAAYHGNTAAVTEVSPSSQPGEPPRAHVRVVPAPDGYRAPTAEVASRFAAARGRIDDSKRAAPVRGFSRTRSFRATACSPTRRLSRPVRSRRPAARRPVHRRRGAARFRPHRRGVVGLFSAMADPDIVTMGKPMGNGYPMGGVATRPELLAAARPRSSTSTRSAAIRSPRGGPGGARRDPR